MIIITFHWRLSCLRLGEKKLLVDEFYPIYSQVLKDKDQGVYEDFIECLKLYDKAEDGHMIGGELTHILLSLGKLKCAWI